MIVSLTNGLQNQLHCCSEYKASLTYVIFKQSGYDYPHSTPLIQLTDPMRL